MSSLARSASAIAVQRRDRPWLNAYVAAIVGPFEMPALEEVRGAVTKLIDAYPQSRLNWRLNRTGRYWHPDRMPESLVAEAIWPDGLSIGEILNVIVADGSLSPPLSLLRFDNYLALRMSHGLGDGRVYSAILSSVVHTALTGQMLPWGLQPSGRWPLTAAACRTFGRRPSLISAAIADRYPKDRAYPGESRPWCDSRRTIVAAIPRSKHDDVIGALANRLGASRLGVQICLTLRALRDAGITVSSDVGVIVDLRRYLGRPIDGNFLAGVPIRLTSNMTAEQISAKVRTTIHSGRPLAGQLLSSLRAGSAITAEATSVNSNEPVRVTFSSLETPELNRLPTLSGYPLVAAASVQPDGPHGLTVLNVETQDLTWINASFHDNIIDAHRLQRALESISTDPARLVYEPVGAS